MASEELWATQYDGPASRLGYRGPKLHKILVFVCLQKGTKLCYDVTKSIVSMVLVEDDSCSLSLVVGQNNDHNRDLCHHNIVWSLFGE